MNNVSRETEVKLQQFIRILEKWNPRINLVAPDTLRDVRSRHIDDCLQLADLTSTPSGNWVDLGSGGGFPGIVMGIAMQGQPLAFTLIESDKRKAAFLKTIVRDLDLPNVTIVSERVEQVTPMNAEQVSARALAPLDRLLAMVQFHLAPNGVAWLMKGRTWRDECDAAKRNWKFDFEAFPSRTDPDAAILKVTGVSAYG